jgi:hypothetical protein
MKVTSDTEILQIIRSFLHHVRTETGLVPKMLCSEILKALHSIRNNCHVHCYTPSQVTFRITIGEIHIGLNIN